MIHPLLFPLVPLPKKCVTRIFKPNKRHRPRQVSISSTSEEVRDQQNLIALVLLIVSIVSISSTSEEVRDREDARRALKFYKSFH